MSGTEQFMTYGARYAREIQRLNPDWVVWRYITAHKGALTGTPHDATCPQPPNQDPAGLSKILFSNRERLTPSSTPTILDQMLCWPQFLADSFDVVIVEVCQEQSHDLGHKRLLRCYDETKGAITTAHKKMPNAKVLVAGRPLLYTGETSYYKLAEMVLAASKSPGATVFSYFLGAFTLIAGAGVLPTDLLAIIMIRAIWGSSLQNDHRAVTELIDRIQTQAVADFGVPDVQYVPIRFPANRAMATNVGSYFWEVDWRWLLWALSPATARDKTKFIRRQVCGDCKLDTMNRMNHQGHYAFALELVKAYGPADILSHCPNSGVKESGGLFSLCVCVLQRQVRQL